MLTFPTLTADCQTSMVDGGEDGAVDGGRWEGRNRQRWPVGRTVLSTVAGGKDCGKDCGRCNFFPQTVAIFEWLEDNKMILFKS